MKSVKIVWLVLCLSLILFRPVSPAKAALLQRSEPEGDESRAGARVEPVVEAPASHFDLSRIDQTVVRQFQKAWRMSYACTRGSESLVLLFRTLRGNYVARVHGRTHERDQVTFDWVPNAVAIVHTHPTRSDPWPSQHDISVSDRFRVPIFTITLRGMWGYDPQTRKMAQIFKGLDWLDSKKWAQLAETIELAQL